MSFDAKLNTVNGYYDISIAADGDIETQDSFDTALLMSLFCERRALPSEVTVSNLRRGWIGNDGFEIGSKLWLYEQARITRDTMNGANTAANNGLKWLVDDKLLASINAVSAVTTTALSLTVELQRFNSQVEYRYFDLWSNTGVN